MRQLTAGRFLYFSLRIFACGLFFSSISYGQSTPVRWELGMVKNSDHQYTLKVQGTVAPGWRVYAADDTGLGLRAIELSWEDERIIKNNATPVIISAVKTYKDSLFENKRVKIYDKEVKLEQTVTIPAQVPAALKIKISGFAAAGEEFAEINEEVTVSIEEGVVSAAPVVILKEVDIHKPLADCGNKEQVNTGSLPAVFMKGFAGGLLALLMPCIFPMLPVTVSFFMQRADNKKQGIKNGILYGFFIFLIYVLASLPFHIVGNVNPQLFNSIATNKWVNLSFFIVFVVFALSLFGWFELTLPGAIANRAERKSNSSSWSGIFFMALTLAIVSFSCTGPILGFLLVNSLNGGNGALALTMGLAGFGLALALPFALFAMFPRWMKKLPGSGDWMTTMKKSLAFAELAMAFKFLSNADMVEHWGILKREVFIGIWFLITLLMALYLLGWPGGIKRKKRMHAVSGQAMRKPALSPYRIALGWLVLAFALYLLPGITATQYAQLRWVSGFPPPLSYSVYGDGNRKGKTLEPDVRNDYEKAKALARRENKPILIDFTGWACVNCRKMEEQVWTNEKVSGLIKAHFVVVSLYVDDRSVLPALQQFNYTDKKGEDHFIKRVGDKWALFQSENFASASQPQYVMLSPDGSLMNYPVGYTPAEEYVKWLQCGLQTMRMKGISVMK